MARKEKKYHYLYRTVNILNNKYYYGIHSTDNLDDGYLGSGKYLRNSIHRHGKENFKREILKFFENREDLIKGEEEFITKEVVNESKCMNLCKGGYASLNGMVSVKDSDGNTFSVFRDDPRFLSNELVSVAKGRVPVKDKDDNYFNVLIDDPRYLSGELISNMIGLIPVKDLHGVIFHVPINDPRYLSGELIFIHKNKIVVKDKNNVTFQVSTNDPRYLSGELKPIWKDRKHSDATKKKIGLSNSKKQTGNDNSQFGTCWITLNNENKKIKKEELSKYESLGWAKGRVINNGR